MGRGGALEKRQAFLDADRAGDAALAGVVNLIIMTTLYLTIARRRAALAFAG